MNVRREHYLKMMIEIGNIEAELTACEAYGAGELEIKRLNKTVIDKYKELHRISYGCG